MKNQGRDSAKKTAQQKPASADTMAKTTRKGSIELDEEQLGRASGGGQLGGSQKK